MIKKGVLFSLYKWQIQELKLRIQNLESEKQKQQNNQQIDGYQ
jgi:hypothetical protein